MNLGHGTGVVAEFEVNVGVVVETQSTDLSQNFLFGIKGHGGCVGVESPANSARFPASVGQGVLVVIGFDGVESESLSYNNLSIKLA